MLWHEHIKRTIKLALTSALHYSGLLAIRRRAAMRERALILMYHRVNPAGYGAPDYSPVGMSVTPEEFDMQMDFVSRTYRVVPLSRIVAAVRGDAPFDANMCAVTFDDGWQDIYEFALPILRKRSIPATVFLSSGLVRGTRWFWEERVKYLLALVHSRRASPVITDSTRQLLKKLELEQILYLTPARLAVFLGDQVRMMKGLQEESRNARVESLEQLASQVAADAPRPFLNDAEIQEMARNAIEFGHHTVRHPILPELTDQDLLRELDVGSTDIKELAGQTPIDFAYPYGKFDARVREYVKRKGFRSACTTQFGLVEPGSDPFELKRVNMCSDIAAFRPLFAARILGW